MAINIFQGSSSKNTKQVNSAKSSTRAQQAKAALAQPAQVSNSGSTAVGSNGTLQKVGKFVGEAAGIVSKFAPGITGTIAKGLNNLLNDPEWWQSVPGDACTLNTPLRMVKGRGTSVIGPVAEGTTSRTYTHTMMRPAIAEFISGDPLDASADTPGLYNPTVYQVMNPSETAITQYLMPEIRKVVNAIPLQSATSYKEVLVVNATAYALWRNLKRYKFMVDNGHTYLPNMNDSSFPILSVENAEKLSAYINRLEEYLRSNVRLPHTLCEYLSWRFGRVYKSTRSAKAGLILYNVLPMDTPITGGDNVVSYESYITGLLSILSQDTKVQQANTDMFNAYYDHDLWVEIRDDTQFMYDAKEFCLRTNLDIMTKIDYSETFEVDGVRYKWKPTPNDNPNPVYIDSDLDIPTAFMASTVSTLGKQGNEWSLLFPVNALNAYVARPEEGIDSYCLSFWGNGMYDAHYFPIVAAFASGKTWAKLVFKNANDKDAYDPNFLNYQADGWCDPSVVLYDLLICKPLDIYNKDVYLKVNAGQDSALAAYGLDLDMTSLSMDTASVTDETIAVEHVYAFANLVHVGRKSSMGYAAAEKMVARDTANLVEKLDIAQAKS